jgi:predicted nucleic acid-binding protein
VRRILLDTNVLLDVLLDRAPHAAPAGELWAAIERGEAEAVIPAHAATTVYYIAAKARGATFARRTLADLLSVFGVAPVDAAILRRALVFPARDFEDAVCLAAAEAAACGAIVSRDPRGFPGASLPILDAGTALALLRGRGPRGVSELRPSKAGRRR